MLKKILVLLVIILVSGCGKEKNIVKEKEPIYTKTATCYGGGIGDAVLSLKSNDKETLVVGESIYYVTSQSWLNDKLGGYSYEDKIKEVLAKQSDTLDKFSMELLSSYDASNREEHSSYDSLQNKL